MSDGMHGHVNSTYTRTYTPAAKGCSAPLHNTHQAACVPLFEHPNASNNRLNLSLVTPLRPGSQLGKQKWLKKSGGSTPISKYFTTFVAVYSTFVKLVSSQGDVL